MRLLPAAVACSSCLPCCLLRVLLPGGLVGASDCLTASQSQMCPRSHPSTTFRPGLALACHRLLCPAVAAGLRGPAGDAPDAYLGLLSTEDDLRLFGFLSNTRVKLVVAVDDPVVKDDEMRAVSWV